MKEEDKGMHIFMWVIIIYSILLISCLVVQIIDGYIAYDEQNRYSVYSYCVNYVFEDFKQDYGDFDLIVGIGEISYIQELNEENVKSAGYNVDVQYRVDGVFHVVNYHIDIWWKERNFLDRRTDKIRENQIIDYEIVKVA